MRSRGVGPTVAALFVFVAAGCSSAATPPALDSSPLHACTTPAAGPVSRVPTYHRATAPGCDPTPADANFETYAAAGNPCTSDDQCSSTLGLSGRCLHGACAIDRCLTDDDCGAGAACICSSHTPNSAILNMNYCVDARAAFACPAPWTGGC